MGGMSKLFRTSSHIGLAPLGVVCSFGLLTGCSSDEESTEGPAVEIVTPTVVYLPETDHLVRASMALRGVRPSVEELEAVAADPGQLDAIVDGYLSDPRFGLIMRDLHNEALLSRVDYFFFPAGFVSQDGVPSTDSYYINTSIQDASLRLIEHVIMTDAPYSEIVTANYTIANPITVAVWGSTPYEQGGPEWQVTEWTDGRGNAGILSDPWLVQRHSSTVSNANRGRANAFSKALLCYDFLDRDIVIDSNVNLADPNVVQEAVTQNQACASCHQALDPLASFFQDWFPIFVPADTPYPIQSYYPGVFTEVLGVEMRQPSYFGQSGESLEDLGRLMADDPRFSLCASQRFYAFFNQVDLDDVPLERASELQEAFLDSGLNAKALAREVVLSDDFRTSHIEAPADMLIEGHDDVVGMRKARPEQLGYMFEDLTGYRWQVELPDIGRVDVTQDSFIGFRVLGGGIDSQFVTRPSLTDSATSSLYLRALAAEAASYAVERDFATPQPSERKLLRMVGPSDTDETLVRAQLVWLHKRILGEIVEPMHDDVSETFQLFADALVHSGDVERAWKTTLTAMMQDLRVSYY